MLLTRAVRIALIVLVLLFVAYTVLGFWLVPRLVRSNLVGFAGEQYHRVATLGEVRFNPFTLKLEMRDFSLPDADGAQLLGFERLLLNFDVSSVWRVGASFAAVELDQPFVRVLLRPDGSLNLVDLSHLANPGPPSESDETPRVFIDRLSVSTGRVAFEDRARAAPFATELRPITFELRDFSTGGESGNAYSLRGASLDGESFAWSGSFRLTPLSSSGKFEVSALKARTVWSYLREALAFELTKGVINLNGEYFYDAARERRAAARHSPGQSHRSGLAPAGARLRLRGGRGAGHRGDPGQFAHASSRYRSLAARRRRVARARGMPRAASISPSSRRRR